MIKEKFKDLVKTSALEFVNQYFKTLEDGARHNEQNIFDHHLKNDCIIDESIEDMINTYRYELVDLLDIDSDSKSWNKILEEVRQKVKPQYLSYVCDEYYGRLSLTLQRSIEQAEKHHLSSFYSGRNDDPHYDKLNEEKILGHELIRINAAVSNAEELADELRFISKITELQKQIIKFKKENLG